MIERWCRTHPLDALFRIVLGCCGLGAVPSGGVHGQQLREVGRLSASRFDLSVVAMVTASPNGTIWASQPQDGVIVGLAPGSGSLVRIGSKGEGPGSFRDVFQLHAGDAELWVFDRTLRRASLFGTGWRLASTERFVDPTGLAGPDILSAGPSGLAWWRTYGSDPGIFRSSREGAEVKRMTPYLVPKCSVGTRTGTSQQSVAIPFCHREIDAFSSDARYRVIATPVRGDRDSAGVQLLLKSWQGDSIFARTIWLTASPIARSTRDSAIRRLQRFARGAMAPIIQELVDGPRLPREHSPLVDVDVSPEGAVVLTARDGSTGGSRGYFIAPRGSNVVSFTVGSSQEVRWVGGRRILMVESDPDGLQDVVLYELP